MTCSLGCDNACKSQGCYCACHVTVTVTGKKQPRLSQAQKEEIERNALNWKKYTQKGSKLGSVVDATTQRKLAKLLSR